MRLKMEDVKVENPDKAMDAFKALLGRLVRAPKAPRRTTKTSTKPSAKRKKVK